MTVAEKRVLVCPVPQNASHVSAGMNPERAGLSKERGSYGVNVLNFPEGKRPDPVSHSLNLSMTKPPKATMWYGTKATDVSPRYGVCLKTIFLALILGAAVSLSGSSSAGAAEKPAVVRLDFIIGGKHAPWFVAWEKGFYSKRGLSVTIQAGSGSADTVRAIGAGLADVGFADMTTTIVARSRGAPVQVAAQLGYVPTTILWREETPIKTLKDLEGKSLAISPGQAQWYLMPAYAKINNIDFKAIRIQETSPALQPAALVAKKVDFIVMFRASNDEVTETAATKQGIKLKRIYMKDTGLNIYGSGLIVKEEDVKRRPEMIRAYVEGTMEGLRYAREHPDEALQILLKQKPELNKELTRIQLKNALEEVFIPPESLEFGFGYMKPDIMEKTVGITNDYFDGARKVTAAESYTNQFIKK